MGSLKKNKPDDQVNKMTSAEIREKLCNPPVLAEKDQYRIKFAMTPEEVEAAFRLRYQVFKVEQGKNIEDSGKPGIDQDEFDQYCLHLVVEGYRVFRVFLLKSFYSPDQPVCFSSCFYCYSNLPHFFQLAIPGSLFI